MKGAPTRDGRVDGTVGHARTSGSDSSPSAKHFKAVIWPTKQAITDQYSSRSPLVSSGPLGTVLATSDVRE
jgi:hypothetical protein